MSDEFLAGHLAILAAVADHGGVTAAAKALNLTQPAVSNRLRTLETFVGGALVTRSGRRIVLTELGEELLPHARAITRATARASVVAAALRQTAHEVRVAISEAAIPLVMPRLTRCASQSPSLVLQARSCDASTAVRAVVAGEVDLAVSVAAPEPPADDLQRRSLLLDEIVLVGAGVRASIMDIDAVRSLSVLWQAAGSGVRATVERVLERAGAWPARSVELGSSLGVLAAAAAGQGAAFLPRSYVAVWADAGRVAVTAIRTSDLFARFELISDSPDHLPPGPRLVYDELLASVDHYTDGLGGACPPSPDAGPGDVAPSHSVMAPAGPMVWRMATSIPAGLCDRCAHQRLVRTTRGPGYSLCERSRTDPATYPRYPRLPVLRCGGFEAASGGAGGGTVSER